MALKIIEDNEKRTLIEETTTDKRRFELKDLEGNIQMLEDDILRMQSHLTALKAKRVEVLALRTKH